MKLSATTLTTTLLIHPALAIIGFGISDVDPNNNYTTNGSGYHAAWIAEEDPCNGGLTIIGPAHENPCGIPFKLWNGYTYTLRDCGNGHFASYDADGSYNHKCTFSGDRWRCPGPLNLKFYVHQDWNC